MKRIVLAIHLLLLVAAAGALVYTYFIAAHKIDTLTRLTFWLVVVSSVLGIINFFQTAKKGIKIHV